VLVFSSHVPSARKRRKSENGTSKKVCDCGPASPQTRFETETQIYIEDKIQTPVPGSRAGCVT
jgi:hypothetical protein